MKLSLNVKKKQKKEEFFKEPPKQFYNSIINEDEIIYELRDIRNNSIVCYSKSFMKKYLIIVLGMIVMFGIIVSSSIFIREVAFSGYEDERVYQEVNQNLKKIGPFYYPVVKLNVFESKLRADHPEYAWIGLRKEASLLYIDIDKIDVEVVPEEVTKKGDIVSSAYGVIDKMVILRGKSNVSLGDVVKKGQVLVSGMIDEKNVVSPFAYVYANTYNYEKVVVDKCYQYNSVKLVNSKFSFIESANSKVIFDFYFFKIYRNYSLEINSHNDVRRVEEGRMYAESIVKKNFNSSHNLDSEILKEIKIISFVEDEEHFEFTFLVNKYENIATFVEYWLLNVRFCGIIRWKKVCYGKTNCIFIYRYGAC